MELVNGDEEILDGIYLKLTGGHTRGHQVVFIQSNGKKGMYFADLVPTTSHIKIPYVMGYDLYPVDTMKKKKELLENALKEHWVLIFEHDPNIGYGYLDKKDDLCVIPIE